MTRKTKTPKQPPRDRWASLASTRDEALRLGEPYYYSGKPCRQGHDALRTPGARVSGECTECKRLSNVRVRSRKRGATPEGKADQTAHHQRLRERGIHPTNAGGWTGYINRRPPWMTDADRDAIKAFRADRPRLPTMQVDHVVAIDHWKVGNAITGLDVLANLQYLSPGANRRKGSHLPDPANWNVKADRPLTYAEQAAFVRAGMAVWSRDVSDTGIVAWDRYRQLPNCEIERVEAEAAE